MEKEIKDLSSWIEVTPALFISLRKTSSSPALETITEEEAEGGEDDDQYKIQCVSLSISVVQC